MKGTATRTALALVLACFLASALALPALADGDRDGDGMPDARDRHPSIAAPALWAQLELVQFAGDAKGGGGAVELAPRATDERPDWPGGGDAATRDLFSEPRATLAATGARELGMPSQPRTFAAALAALEARRPGAASRARRANHLRVVIRLANPLAVRQRWALRAIRLVVEGRTVVTLPGGRWDLAPHTQLFVRLAAPLSAAACGTLLDQRAWPALTLDGDAPARRASVIEAATVPLRLAIPGRELCWRVARRISSGAGDGSTRALTAGEALAALDALLKREERPLVAWAGGALRAVAGRSNLVDQRWWRVTLEGKHVTGSDWRARPLGDAGMALRFLRRSRAEGVALDGRRYRRAAEGGDAWAATVYGVCLHNGYGVPRDREAALRWFRAAAPKDSGAQVRLGRALLSGKGGVKRDLAQARTWFARAAEGGHPDGQRYLARLLIRANNGAEAAPWCRRAALAGHVQAQMELGICYLHGVGVAKDESTALRWFRTAAHEGLTRARSSWGWCLVNGRGAPVDRAFGLELLRRSAAQGCDYAKRVLRVQGELPR